MNTPNLYLERRKTVSILLVISLLLGHLPWYNFSAVLGEMSNYYALTANQTGWILATFQFGYVILVFCSGWIIEIIGERRAMAWSCLGAGITSLMLVFLARGFWSILLIRFTVGLFCGLIYVPGMLYLSKLYPAGMRGRVLGAYTGALSLAFAGGYFIAGPLAAMYSWQTGIFWTSIPAVAGWYIILYYLEDISKRETPGADADIVDKSQAGLVPDRKYGPLVVTLGYMGHTWELHAFGGWIGPFIVASASAAGWDESSATFLGGQLSAFIILSGAISVYLLGWVADWWGKSKTIIFCAASTFFVQSVYGFFLEVR